MTIVRFTSGLSLREAVLFVLRELPPRGFFLGRGDAEPTEADAPFTRAGVNGQVRMVAVTPCRTEWLVAVGRAAANGPVFPRAGSASPSPLASFG